MTEEKKVRVHGTASKLPGSPHKQRRYSEAITNAPPPRNVLDGLGWDIFSIFFL